jgi:hypothetical protein
VNILDSQETWTRKVLNFSYFWPQPQLVSSFVYFFCLIWFLKKTTSVNHSQSFRYNKSFCIPKKLVKSCLLKFPIQGYIIFKSMNLIPYPGLKVRLFFTMFKKICERNFHLLIFRVAELEKVQKCPNADFCRV